MFYIVPPFSNNKFPDGSLIYIEKTTVRFVHLKVYKPVTNHYTVLNKRSNELYDGTTYEYEYTLIDNGIALKYENVKVSSFDTTLLIKHKTTTPFK